MNLEEVLKAQNLSEEQMNAILAAVPKNDETQAELERLRKHNDKLLAEKKAESDKRRAEQEEKDRLAEEAARKKGDLESLEKQYQERIAKLEQQIVERDRQRDSDMLKATALKLASELSDNVNNQAILQMLIEKRLVAESGQIKVVDDSGNASIASLDELKSEFAKSGKYDSLITGTRASGTGGSGVKKKVAHEYSEQERVQLATTNPALFEQIFGV